MMSANMSVEALMEVKERVLTNKRDLIVEHLDPDSIIDLLIQERLVSKDAVEVLQTEPSTRKRNRLIIDQLLHAGPEALDTFCAILKEKVRQIFIAEELEKEKARVMATATSAADDSSANGGPPTDSEDKILDQILKPDDQGKLQKQKEMMGSITPVWNKIGLYLGLSQNQIDIIDHKFKKPNVEDCCWEMINKWLSRLPSRVGAADALIKAIDNQSSPYYAGILTETLKGQDILEEEYLRKNVVITIATDWKKVGLELDVRQKELDNIEDGNLVETKCIDMLSRWLNKKVKDKSVPTSWRTLIEAMKSAELIWPAAQLKKKLLNQ